MEDDLVCATCGITGEDMEKEFDIDLSEVREVKPYRWYCSHDCSYQN